MKTAEQTSDELVALMDDLRKHFEEAVTDCLLQATVALAKVAEAVKNTPEK